MRKLLTLIPACILALTMNLGLAFAEYPDKPITLVVPFGPGGVTDLAGRALAASAQKFIGQPVLVANKAGASGTTGSHFVKNSRPDGYTLLLARVAGQSVYPAQNLPNKLYEWDDFTIFTILDLNPFVFVVRKDSPYKSLKELAEAIKANPGKLKYSHSGPTTILALGPQMLASEVGAKPSAVVGVPFTSDGDAKVALLGGNVDFLGVNLAGVIDQLVEGGGLRALALVSEKRMPELPDVPTVSEAGFQKLKNLAGWSGVYGPPNLPKEVYDKWISVLQQVKNDPDWLNVTLKLGNTPVMNSPEEAKKFVQEQIEAFKSVYNNL